MTLGEKLSELRQKSGLSQDRVAEILGVSRQAVSKWERDEAKPDLDNIVNLSNIYNVTTDYLLKEQTERVQQEKRGNNYRSSSFFESILKFIKEKWYWLGYGVAAWGISDIISAIIGKIMMRSFAGFIFDYGQEALETDLVSGPSEMINSWETVDPNMEALMNAPSNLLWLPVVLGIIKITVGIIVVIYGRRYVRRMKAKEYR
ncbi:helix-turn-helix domain-containing protein [Alloiococcus sp. CFN-8]|uniref:helix-turn-helix domain-containing protein n=1 Tax=Alloiococcus sp. CFN-8 TaxID=3416081 RepID=UPI003CEBFA10